MTYSTILFDVGDTLVQVPKPASVYRQILQEHGAALDLEDVEALLAAVRGIVDEAVPRWATDDFVLNPEAAIRRRTLHVETLVRLAGVWDAEAARRALFDLYVGRDFFTLFPDVVETLGRIRQAGYRLGIVSNWEHRLLTLCEAHGIRDFFDFAIISEVEGFLKPHAELYRRALQRAGQPAERVLHVGDKLTEDVEGAAQVGIRTVLIDRAGTLDTEYLPRIRSLPELLGLLGEAVGPGA